MSGYQCTEAGLSAPNKLIPAGGYYNSWKRNGNLYQGYFGEICPSGSYCPEGSVFPILCPPGTWSDSLGLKSEYECTPCPIGYLCAAYGINSLNKMISCPVGYYCPT